MRPQSLRPVGFIRKCRPLGLGPSGWRAVFGVALAVTLLGGSARVSAVELLPDAPTSYTVNAGDTLWSIAGRFLRDPWRWRELWASNAGPGDPDLIYPGDVLRLSTVDGQPRLGVDRGGESAGGYRGGMRVVKLSPRVRVSALRDAVPTIPIASIGPFLTQPYVANSDQIKRAPYVVGFPDEHIVAGVGDAVYVRRIEDTVTDQFQVLRPGDALRDPQTNEILGYESVFVANVALERVGDPAKVRVLRAEREVAIGDRVIPAAQEETLSNFYPRPAPAGLRGQILSVLNGVTQVAHLDVVVINLGTRERLEPGHIFDIYQGGNKVLDQVRSGGANIWAWREESPLSGSFWFGNDWTTRSWRHAPPDDSAPIPPTTDMRRQRGTYIHPFERSGVLMVFRTFERVSFAIVLDATRAMHINDQIAPPPA
ncbi:MAG TPA: LysM domain-containing protein [Lamprocystis sp. (in: g-proteobacteria)]|nr:LysM domain-containing protein [Lamprocystis sp. (in: g-proteobacteria)]